MPMHITCPSCNKTLNVRDELAGKRIKCPACTATLAVPAPSAAPEKEPDVAEESRSRKRGKKRKSKSGKAAQPLFTLGSIEFTPLKLLAVGGMGVIFLALVVVVILLTQLGSIFSWEPDSQFVDVHTPVNGFRDTKAGAIILQGKSVPYSIPGHKKIIVTRPNPNGQYLLVTVPVSSKEIAQYFANSRGPISLMTLTREHILLAADGLQTPAQFVLDRTINGERGYHLGWDPPEQENRKPDLREHLGPGKNGWTHEGNTNGGGQVITFEGSTGMSVKTQVGDERLDGSEDRSLLGDVTGTKLPKDLSGGLVAGPSAYVFVTWNKGSTGWMLDTSIEQPNDLSLTRTIQCFFPRPTGDAKNAKLIVLGKPRQLKF
jgi:hypothetical protein